MQKILLIEDEDQIRDVYKEELEASGFEVHACPTGKEGLEIFFKGNFDLILLDLVLPDVSGLHVLKEIKRDNPKENTPVLVLSNLAQDIVKRQSMEFGADAYFEKVANTPDVIVGKIKSILQKVSAKKDLK